MYSLILLLACEIFHDKIENTLACEIVFVLRSEAANNEVEQTLGLKQFIISVGYVNRCPN